MRPDPVGPNPHIGSEHSGERERGACGPRRMIGNHPSSIILLGGREGERREGEGSEPVVVAAHACEGEGGCT